MTWTEITETDFKLSFCLVCRALRKHSKTKTRVVKQQHPLRTPPVCLSRQLCLSFVFLSVLDGSKTSSSQFWSFHPDVSCKKKKKKKSMVSSVCGCISVCFGWHFPLSSAVPTGSREEDEEEALKKKQLQEEQLSKVGEKCLKPSEGMLMWVAWDGYGGLLCRSSPVWGSSFWRKRGKKSRSGSGMRVASLLSATTPNKATAMQVRAASWTAHSALVCWGVKRVSVHAAVPHSTIKSNFKLCLASRSDFPHQNQLLARL